jgi:hypothetical protein
MGGPLNDPFPGSWQHCPERSPGEMIGRVATTADELRGPGE